MLMQIQEYIGKPLKIIFEKKSQYFFMNLIKFYLNFQNSFIQCFHRKEQIMLRQNFYDRAKSLYFSCKNIFMS